MSQANAASLTAVLKFRRGPEKGKQFEVRDELVHLGRGQDSHFRLRAKDLQDYELSIVLRNNRFAIYSSRDDTVSVEGNVLPAEKWVWLPEQVLVKVGTQTEFEFEVRSAGGDRKAAAKSPSQESAAAEEANSDRPRSRSRSRSPKSSPSGKKSGAQAARKRAVARFITDKVGDPLVQLGEDGTLPELHLDEASGGTKRKTADADKQQKNDGNPLLVGIALAFSVVSSTILLLVDVGAGGGGEVDKSTARREIESFYGGQDDDDLEDYQILLRQAALAHSREDFDAEEKYYRQVLRMLVSEDNQGLIRLTENRERDRELRDLLSVLLAE